MLGEFIQSDNERTDEESRAQAEWMCLEMTETDSAVTEAGRFVSENM